MFFIPRGKLNVLIICVLCLVSLCADDHQLLRACINAKMAAHTYTQLATNAALASSSAAAASVEPPTPIESVVATLQVRCFNCGKMQPIMVQPQKQ
jgi:hypothetical protein